MKQFIVGLRSSNGQVQPPLPVYGCTDPLALNYNPLATISDGSCMYDPSDFDPNTIVLKLDGWWINGVDQIATTNLTVSGSQYALPNTTALKDSSALISFNEWYLAGVPVLIEKSQISNYCASRQFYSASKDELFIIKKGEHLTQAEEDGLVSYLSISKEHSYHINSTALFARFTNTYSAQEKSRIDNVIRLLIKESIWSKIDKFYLAALSGEDEQVLNWIEDSNNLTTINGNTERVKYRGLAPQTGTFTTGISPALSEKMSIDDAFMSFKTYLNPDIPYANYYFGTGDEYFKVRPYGLYYAINFTRAYPIYFLRGTSKLSDTLTISLNNGVARAFIKDTLKINQNVTFEGLSAGDIQIGGGIANNGQSNPNNIQFLSWGSYLTDNESIFLNSVIDNFCYGQTALDTIYVEQPGLKVYQLEHPIFEYNNGMCIWSDYTKINFSKDGGETVFSSVTKPIGHIQFARIFDNGKIIFAMSTNKIYKTDENLVLVEMTPTKYGSPYTIHTPVNVNYPGEYYKELTIRKPQYLDDGREICVWSSYGNVVAGSNPFVVWYSFGDDVKVAFEYGQNPYFKDGGFNFGGTVGNLLGSATETTRSRHSHGVSQRPDNKNIFYSTGGDYDRAAIDTFSAFYESNWVTLEYNPILDTWSKIDVIDRSWYTKWKSSSPQMPDDGYIYFTSDASDLITYPNEAGIFKVAYNQLGNDAATTRVYLPETVSRPLMASYYDGTEFVGQYSIGGYVTGLFTDPNILYSNSGFSNIVEHRLKIPGNIIFVKTIPMGNNKYLFVAMPEYSYSACFSIIIEFN